MPSNFQKAIQRIAAFFAAHDESLRRQGAVVAGWRHRQGKKYGPFFRIDVREEGRKCSVHLGPEGPLVAAARQLLKLRQQERDANRQSARLLLALRHELRIARAQLAQKLKAEGLFLKGSEIRGIARLKKLQALAALPELFRRPTARILEKPDFGDQLARGPRP